MSGFELIAALAGTLGWPLVVLAAMYVFRKPLTERIGTIRRLEWGDKSIDFDLKLDRVEQAAEALPPPIPILQLPAPESKVEEAIQQAEDARFQNALDIAPRFAVLDAWLPIETELQRLGLEKGYDSRSRSLTFLIRRLHTDGVLDRQTMSLLDDLRMLRNHAVHRADDTDISSEDAKRYRELAERVTAKLRVSS